MHVGRKSYSVFLSFDPNHKQNSSNRRYYCPESFPNAHAILVQNHYCMDHMARILFVKRK